MVDDPQDEELYEGIRIIGDETAADDVEPGRSVFDAPFEEDDELDLPSWSPDSPVAADVPGAATPPAGAGTDWDSLNREGPRWADAEPEATVAHEPVGEGGDEFFGFDDNENDSFSKFDEKVPDFNPSLLPPDDTPVGEAAEQSPLTNEPVATASQAPPAQPAAHTSDRNLPMAIGTALALAGVALVCFLIGSAAVMVFATAVLGLAAAEFFNAVRPAGYNPPALLGIAAVVSMSLAAYWRGEVAIPMVLVLTFLFGALWYLTGVSLDRPTANLSVMFLGVVWIGVLGSYASLMLAGEQGRGLLFAAIVTTIAYDTGAWGVGRVAGRQPLSPTSPNKTVEGLIGGSAVAIIIALVLFVFDQQPFGGDGGGILKALLLGIVVAIVAPLGDLAESLFKRDLGLKDMGSFLPGHGGVLDRFDALLFVLPAVYFLSRIVFDFV